MSAPDRLAGESDREYAQRCMDLGLVPPVGTYVLDAPLVVGPDFPKVTDWAGVTLVAPPIFEEDVPGA